MKLAKKKKKDKANKLVPEFIRLEGYLENVEFFYTKTNGAKYDFNRFFLPLKCIRKIYNNEITLNEAIEKQAKLKELINKLNNYGPRNLGKIEEKNRVLKSARKLSDARDGIINFFEKGIFLYKDKTFKTKENKESEEELEENK